MGNKSIDNLFGGLKKIFLITLIGLSLYGCPSLPAPKPSEETTSQELTTPQYNNGLRFSKDPYEFIPKGAHPVYAKDLTGDGILETYWWDKNKNKIAEEDEIFIDLNQDGIIDVSLQDFIKLIEEKKQKAREERRIKEKNKWIV